MAGKQILRSDIIVKVNGTDDPFDPHIKTVSRTIADIGTDTTPTVALTAAQMLMALQKYDVLDYTQRDTYLLHD